MKKFMCLVLMMCMLLSAVPFAVFSAGEELTPNPEAYPNFALDNWEALYAHADLGGDSTDAWQKWMRDYAGINAEEGVRYFFLPVTADDEKVEIYNGYSEDAVIGDVTVPTHASAFIDYVEGEAISVTVGSSRSYTFKVLRSNAEAALYINDTTNSYEDYAGEIQETDLWNFLIQNKENSVSTATYSIASSAGIEDGDLKKIKGRGNTNWKETDKKPFNINFDEMTTIGHTTSKKFSLVSNAKDSTLLRNSIMYDLADSVGNPYSPSQSFIDFYVNGVYRGSYIACQKIDLGKNAVVSLKDESEDIATDFNFLVEVDVWNYAADTYFESDRGYHVVLKTPDLEDFETGSEEWQTRFDYIQHTYQELEDTLYRGTLSDIEAICDLDSLATQYLLQELGKNCDGGYTSTFFTYNAKEGKFYAAPIWDCDSCLGAVDVWRDNCTTSTSDHRGWTTRLAKYNRTINPLGQAFYVSGTSSEGQTFQQLCKDIWNERFLPNIDVLLGNASAPAGSRLKSIDSYAETISSSAYNNYIMWDFMWLCQDKNESLTDTYTEDYDGELQYLKDWLEARAEWMTEELNNESPTIPSNPSGEDNRVVYFTTELMWEDVHFYLWGDGHIPMSWPGNKAENIGTTEEGFAIYKAVVDDVDAQKIIFNNGSDGAQTISITISNDSRLYHTTDESGRINEAGQPYYNVDYIPYTEETETTPPEETTSTEPEETTSTEPEDSSAPEDTTSTAPESTTSTEPSETTTLPEDIIIGDADLNGDVNVKDATIIQKHIAGLISLSEEALSVSDTTRDDKVSVSDATAIQKFVAGLLDEF